MINLKFNISNLFFQQYAQQDAVGSMVAVIVQILADAE